LLENRERHKIDFDNLTPLYPDEACAWSTRRSAKPEA
jgi:transcription termination factor Rho